MALRNLFLILIFILLLLSSAQPLVVACDLALDHWAYEYLERMKAKGILENYLDQTKPLPREEIALAISQVQDACQRGDSRITSVERSQLEWLRREFGPELSQLGEGDVAEDRHLFRWSRDEQDVIFDLSGSLNGWLGTSDGDSRRIFDIRAQPLIRGRLGKHLTFAATVVKGEASTNLHPVTGEDVGIRGYFSSRGAIGYYDWSHAYVSLRYPHIELQLGRQPVDWGPGIRGNLSLSAYPPAYDYVTVRARFGRVKFVHLHGFLVSEVLEEYHTEDGFIRQNYAQKYVAAHRLEVSPIGTITMGFTESIVYGERNLDISYLNPLVFFWSAQHSSHDRDNETLSTDVEIQPLSGLRCYGALFIDEIYLKEVFADDARNKVAVQGGIHLVDPLGLVDTDLRFEYARVQPCVYTHKFEVNSYRQDGIPLGHWLEQNGDDLFVMVGHRFSRHFHMAAHMARIRQGEKGQLPWCHAQPARYSFLGGVVDRIVQLTMSLEVVPAKDVRAYVGYQWTERRNRDHISGRNDTRHELVLRLNVEY